MGRLEKSTVQEECQPHQKNKIDCHAPVGLPEIARPVRG